MNHKRKRRLQRQRTPHTHVVWHKWPCKWSLQSQRGPVPRRHSCSRPVQAVPSSTGPPCTTNRHLWATVYHWHCHSLGTVPSPLNLESLISGSKSCAPTLAPACRATSHGACYLHTHQQRQHPDPTLHPLSALFCREKPPARQSLLHKKERRSAHVVQQLAK
jgi:hypothetical protein